MQSGRSFQCRSPHRGVKAPTAFGFAFLDVEGERIFFKVDYYDRDLKCLSPNPSDPGVTRRVLTIALAEEY